MSRFKGCRVERRGTKHNRVEPVPTSNFHKSLNFVLDKRGLSLC